MFGKNKKTKTKNQMPSHVGLVGKLKKKRDYTNYVNKGGELSFKEWSKKQ